MRAWLVLVAVTTLTTYQHHFIDLPAGIAVGVFTIVLFPQRNVSEGTQQRRLSAAYFAGALIIAAVAVRFGGTAWLLLWPAAALLVVSGIYQRGTADGFRKINGRIGQPLRFILSPYITAARLNSRLWTRHDPAGEIAEGVWIGRAPQASECAAMGIASVVDLTAELPFKATGPAYRGVPMLDLLVPTVDQIDAAVHAIDDLAATRPTLVCCALGYSRSATAVVAWLLASGNADSVDAAISRLVAVRPRVRLSEAHRTRLAEWVARRALRLTASA
jgi:protein-tyrosine phosphatase